MIRKTLSPLREVLERFSRDSVWTHSADMYFRTASLQRTDLHHVLKVFLQWQPIQSAAAHKGVIVFLSFDSNFVRFDPKLSSFFTRSRFPDAAALHKSFLRQVKRWCAIIFFFI